MLLKLYYNFKNICSSFIFEKKALKEWQVFENQFLQSNRANTFNYNDRKLINEKDNNHSFDRHYIFHTAWAARALKKSAATKHIDISSSLYFSAITSAFVPTTFYDYRKLSLDLSNFESGQASLTNLLFKDNSIYSLSCMHTLEHIGLGRYGDAIDANGDLHAINELKRVLAVGGNLFVVVPLAAQSAIVFNAHRIYSHKEFSSYFSELSLVEFVLIPEESSDGDLVYNPNENLLQKQKYGCGCYWFTKK